MGGGLVNQEAGPDDFPVANPRDPLEVMAVHEALDRLAQKSPRKAELVKLRYFLGCTMAEAAQILGVAPATAEEDWTYAKAWLRRQCRRDEEINCLARAEKKSPGFCSPFSHWMMRDHPSEGEYHVRFGNLQGRRQVVARTSRGVPRSGLRGKRRAATGSRVAAPGARRDRRFSSRVFLPEPSATIDGPPITEKLGTPSARTSCSSRSAKGAWASSTWPSSRSRSAARSRSRSSNPAWTAIRSSPVSRLSARPWQ